MDISACKILAGKPQRKEASNERERERERDGTKLLVANIA